MTAQALIYARYNYAAVAIQTLSYGAYLVLALMGIQLLQRRRTQQKVTLFYSVFMLVLTTAWYVTTMIITEAVIIESTYNPDDDMAAYCAPTNIAAVALSSIQFAGSDLLLLYRAWVIWDKQPHIVALPALCWLAYVGLAITANLDCSAVGPAITNFDAVALAFYALSVVTNTLCTVLICARIVLHRREIRGAGIGADADYHFLTTVIAESGLWYAVAGIIHLVLLARGSLVDNIAMPIFNSLAYLTQAQVILRVALGVDFKAVTTGAPTTADAHRDTAMAFNSVFGRQTGATSTHTAGGSEVWEMAGTREKDAEAGSDGGHHRRTIPSANRL